MSLGGRLAIAFTLVVVVTATLLAVLFSAATGREATGEVDSFLRDRASELADGRREQPNDRRGTNQTTIDTSGRSFDPDALVQVLDESGEIVSASGQQLPINEDDLEIADKERSSKLRNVRLDGDEFRMITAHISGGGAVQVARSLNETNNLLNSLETLFVVIALLLAVVAALCGWLIAQRTTRPLRDLTDLVDAVGESRDFSTSVNTKAGGEVGRLAQGFNRMLETLQVSRDQQHRLVQDAAHELKTPLTSINANVAWLAHADDLDTSVRSETLASIQGELKELNVVIDEIIELATDSYELEPFVPVDLDLIAHEVVEVFKRRSTHPVELLSEPSVVSGDAEALRRALANLLSNADKYSPDAEPILVKVSAGAIHVSDNGSGIGDGDQERVTQRFYRGTADRSRPGSGLGLSIVASIVSAHGGTLEVGRADSRNGFGGARVGFRLATIDPENE